MTKILIVEDEPNMVAGLRDNFEFEGYQVITAPDGVAGLERALSESADLVILDVMMPRMSGLDVCKQLKAKRPGLPIIMLTARGQEVDKVVGLELGADDYVTKPFSTKELIARVRAAIRRVKSPVRAEDAPIEIGEIRLEPVKRNVTKRGQQVHLTRKEFDILHCLMIRAGRVVTYARLLSAVWGADCREEVEYLRTFVRQLRKKIEDDPSNPVYLLTDVYVGYRFADAQMFPDETAVSAFDAANPDPHSGITS